MIEIIDTETKTIEVTDTEIKITCKGTIRMAARKKTGERPKREATNKIIQRFAAGIASNNEVWFKRKFNKYCLYHFLDMQCPTAGSEKELRPTRLVHTSVYLEITTAHYERRDLVKLNRSTV